MQQLVAVLNGDGVIAYPTDSSYALGCRVGNVEGLERIRRIRHLDERHHFTLMCADFAQLGQLVHVDNSLFRSIRSATPGPYTFILPATREVPRRMSHPKKRTVGVRIPDHAFDQALLQALGEPLLSSTLLLPGDDEPLSDGWEINQRLGHLLDAVVDTGQAGTTPSTVVDFSGGEPEIIRRGAGDPDRFETG